MRAIDRDRLIAMNEIKVRANAFLLLADQYAAWYKDDLCSAENKMACLDDVWRLITEHQIRLTEVLRENGL